MKNKEKKALKFILGMSFIAIYSGFIGFHLGASRRPGPIIETEVRTKIEKIEACDSEIEKVKRLRAKDDEIIQQIDNISALTRDTFDIVFMQQNSDINNNIEEYNQIVNTYQELLDERGLLLNSIYKDE